MLSAARLHDAAGVAQAQRDLPDSANPQTVVIRKAVRMLADLYLGHSDVTLGQRLYVEAGLAALGKQGDVVIRRQFWPYVAYVYAVRGDFKSAHGLIDQTPADCVICLIQRGRIDALEKNWGGAQYWFARASAMAPSPPFAWTDWGQMLLAKGDYEGAIAKFRIAHDKGPQFADPLEMWGEALIKTEPLRSRAGQIRASRELRPQLGPAASQMGRGAAMVRRSCRRAKAIRRCRQTRSVGCRKIRTGEGCARTREAVPQRRCLRMAGMNALRISMGVPHSALQGRF